MKLNKKQFFFYEYSDEVCIHNIDKYEIDSRKNVRVLTFPARINGKPVTNISYFFYAEDWPSLQRIVVPKTVREKPFLYYFDKDPEIEYYDD